MIWANAFVPLLNVFFYMSITISIKILASLTSINYFYSGKRSYPTYRFAWDEELNILCHGSFSGKSCAFMKHMLSIVLSQVMCPLVGFPQQSIDTVSE